MSRSFGALIFLTVPVLLSAAPQLRTPDPIHPVGKWRVVFGNGVVEVSEFGRDGTATVTEPLRSSPGKWKEAEGAILVTFDDDRLERWTRDGAQWRVQHWFPAGAYPEGSPVVGIAKRER